MSDKQCIFCAIIEKAAHGFIVYENPHAVVFLDRRPINVGHLLIVPQHHVEAFYELDEKSFIELMLVVKRMASIIEAIYQPKKVGMLAAGFDVAHAHLHVLPLYDYHDITLGCPNRPLALDRFLDSKCQSRLFHAWWRSIFKEKGVIQARQPRPISIFTTSRHIGDFLTMCPLLGTR